MSMRVFFQRSTRVMSPHHVILKFICAGCIPFLFAECVKQRPQVSDPWQAPGSGKRSDTALAALQQRIQASQRCLAFVGKTATTYGQPQWQFALSQSSDSQMIALVPLIPSGQSRVHAVLAFEWSHALRVKVLEAPDPLQSATAGPVSSAARITLLMEYLIWNRQPSSPLNIQFSGVVQRSPDTSVGGRAMPYAVSICYDYMSCTGDGNGNCVGNVRYHSDCITSIVWAEDYNLWDYGGGYSGWGSGVGGHGGGGTSAPPAVEENIMAPPVVPILDVAAYLSCFDESQGGRLEIFVDQPLPGSDEPFTILGKMGHVFVAIVQTVGGKLVRRNIGFHPATAINPFNRTTAPSALGNDAGKHYDVRLAVDLSADQFQHVLNSIYLFMPQYDLENYNCVDFVLDVAAAGGLNLPRTSGWWIFGRGRNPGAFGEDLRKLPQSMVQGGNASVNTGFCN